MNLAEEELPALVALAELRRRQGDLKAARELLDDVWEPAERGPYPLIHADACNVLAQIERDAGNRCGRGRGRDEGLSPGVVRRRAVRVSLGPRRRAQHLAELGAPEPPMPPFDESKHEPMPEVEINPDDEFHVDEGNVPGTSEVPGT